MGAAELKQLVELKERLRLESDGDGGNGGDSGSKERSNKSEIVSEENSRIDERVRRTLKGLVAEGDVSRDDDAIAKGISGGRGSTYASNNNDATGSGGGSDGGGAFPRSSIAKEEGGVGVRSADENGDSAQPSGDLDGDLPFDAEIRDAEIRDAEERLRALRSQQQRHQEDQQRVEGEDALDKEAAAMDAAVAAVFGQGKLPSDLLRAAKERQRLKRGTSQPDPPQKHEEEGAKTENSTGGGWQEEEEEGEEEGEEEKGKEGQEADEEGEQPEEPRIPRMPPVRYRRRRQKEPGRDGESDAFYTGEEEFEEFVLEDPLGPGWGNDGEEGNVPDAWFVMDRLDELWALEPDASDARLPFQEENLDDETIRLMQVRGGGRKGCRRSWGCGRWGCERDR